MKKIKAIFILLLSVLISISVFASPINAITFFYSNGYELYRDSDSNGWIINSYSEDPSEIVLPDILLDENVTTIGGSSFENRQRLNYVTIPDSFVTIGAYGFSGCTNLRSVNIGSGLKNINAGAFRNCDSLSTVDLSGTVLEFIGDATFFSCDMLMEVNLPDSVTTIGSKAFANCPSLEKIFLNNNVTSISTSAFNGSNNVIIYCYKNSYAHQYAEENLIDYLLLDPVVPTKPTEPPTEPEPTEAAPTEEPTQEPTIADRYLLGDADADGSVSIFDVTVIQRRLGEMYVASFDTRAADVSADGLSVIDATLIQRYLAGLKVFYPIGEWITT